MAAIIRMAEDKDFKTVKHITQTTIMRFICRMQEKLLRRNGRQC